MDRLISPQMTRMAQIIMDAIIMASRITTILAELAQEEPAFAQDADAEQDIIWLLYMAVLVMVSSSFRVGWRGKDCSSF